MQLLSILATAINAVFPIVILIGIGYCLRRSDFISDEFVKIGNKLVFNVCLPCMLFVNVYEIESLSDIRWDVVLYSCLMIFIIFLIGVIVAILTSSDGKRRGVIAQSAFRSNMAIIGLALAASLGGQDAVAVAAVVSAFTVPIFNILAVVSLTMFVEQDEKGNRFAGVLRKIATNPLIIGIVLGMFCLLIRQGQILLFEKPVFLLRRNVKFIYTGLENLGRITSPFALLVLGGQFTFSAVNDLRNEILAGTLSRIILSPLIGIGTAVVLGYFGIMDFDASIYPALIAVFGSPTAVSSAIMAKQMNHDGQLATQLVVWTSIGSIFTIFLTVCILMAMGLLMV
jgi:predicted permease